MVAIRFDCRKNNVIKVLWLLEKERVLCSVYFSNHQITHLRLFFSSFILYILFGYYFDILDRLSVYQREATGFYWFFYVTWLFTGSLYSTFLMLHFVEGVISFEKPCWVLKCPNDKPLLIIMAIWHAVKMYLKTKSKALK